MPLGSASCAACDAGIFRELFEKEKDHVGKLQIISRTLIITENNPFLGLSTVL